MLIPQPLTWCLLKYACSGLRHVRHMSSQISLFHKTGKWIPLLRKSTMLEIEDIWKERIQAQDNLPLSDKGKKKFYVLSMFPYPSGKLHMGHVRVYTISDMLARYHRMLGHKVIHPMGWDAFGLPAENAALDKGFHPKDWTYSNIATMKTQLKDLCCSFDWETELMTCDPSYYKWTQFIFLKLYQAGLVYQSEARVNWDPVDKTVLADEQIDDEGRSWRSGAKVESRYLRQWYIRTTAYAKSLYDGLETVRSDLWGDVVMLQKHWIGNCTGCRIDFKLKVDGEELSDTLSVFTEHPECLYGVSYIALVADHKYNQPKYYQQKEGQSTSINDDILLSLKAVHPLTGQSLSMIVSSHTEQPTTKNDCYLGIPCLFERDREIADKFHIQWQPVIRVVDEKEFLINSQQINGMTRSQAAEVVMKLARDNGFGGHPVSSHLRDWLISRQRYWGTPIPIIHCPTCKAVPVPYEDLPVVLPEATKPSVGKGQSPLLEDEQWLNVPCPKCGMPAKHETDTMDTFVDSSWYFLRYLDTKNSSLPVSREKADAYMPVDLYIGGIEHAYLHLYYARFINHFLFSIGLTSHKEPFDQLLTQGIIKGESYKIQKTGVYIPPQDVELKDGKHVQKCTGDRVIVKYEKMSKSKHNGVDPEELYKEFGVDMTRVCILFNVAPKSDRNWNTEAFVGVERWLNRVWNLVGVLVDSTRTVQVSPQLTQEWNEKIRDFRNKYLLEIRFHLDKTFLLNTAIVTMIQLTNDLKKVPVDVAISSMEYMRAVADLVVMLAPMAPMFSSECWSAMCKVLDPSLYDLNSPVLQQKWPSVDEDVAGTLYVSCNHELIGQLPIQMKEINTLTKEAAFNLVVSQPFYREFVKNNHVANIALNIKDNWYASLKLSVPEISVPEIEPTTDKKIKKKKGKRVTENSQLSSDDY